MNSNEMNFDPMTGQPITKNTTTNNTPVSQQNIPVVQPQQQSTQTVNAVSIETQERQIAENNNIPQQSIQNVPTVEQSKQDFINNTQALTPEKKEEKKDGINYTFIIILFVIIFAAIFFLFPYLLKNL